MAFTVVSALVGISCEDRSTEVAPSEPPPSPMESGTIDANCIAIESGKFGNYHYLGKLVCTLTDDGYEVKQPTHPVVYILRGVPPFFKEMNGKQGYAYLVENGAFKLIGTVDLSLSDMELAAFFSVPLEKPESDEPDQEDPSGRTRMTVRFGGDVWYEYGVFEYKMPF